MLVALEQKSPAMVAVERGHGGTFKTLMTWDLSLVEKYLVSRRGMDPDGVRDLIGEYRKYLLLCLLNPSTKKPISREVDEVWHTHILFTRDYCLMGESVFGRYLHHNPAITPEDMEKLSVFYLKNTIEEYRDIFGEPPSQFWPIDRSVCKECCND